MCGILGYIKFGDCDIIPRNILDMSHSMNHRGPDDEGYVLINFNDGILDTLSGENSCTEIKRELNSFSVNSNLKNSDIVLGHKRLSIIDLTENGHQPMVSNDKKYCVTFNGEIYNYLELRDELKKLGYCFKTQTDTEVLLYSYIHWGIDCLCKFNGMFAFTIWDQNLRRLFCARDRFGIKPFYYYNDSKCFVFGSEIKSLLASGKEKREVNERRLSSYLVNGINTTSEETFFRKINSLSPAHYLIVTENNIIKEQYWKLEAKKIGKNEKDILENVSNLMNESVKRHLRSDVPVSFCLSGGLDSSSLVSIAYDINKGGNKINTFSSCFEDKRYDEREQIEKFINGKNINSNYVFPNLNDFEKDVEKLVWHQEEPFGGISIFAQWCLMKEIHSKGIKVVLDGQGADELFGGYTSFIVPYLFNSFKKINLAGLNTRLKFAKVKLNNVNVWKELCKFGLNYYFPSLFKQIINHRKSGYEWLKSDYYSYDYDYEKNGADPIQFQTLKELNFLRISELLQYEDRNSMAFGIESRVPYLDNDLVEYVYSVPSVYKYDINFTKRLLRIVMLGRLPNEIIHEKKKMGFVTPGEDIWLKKDLNSLINDVFEDKKSPINEFVDTSKLVNPIIQKNMNKVINTHLIWRLINTNLWLKTFFN